MPRKKKQYKGKGPKNTTEQAQTPKQTLSQKAQTLAHSMAQKHLKPSSAQPIKLWMDMVQEE